MAMDGLLHGLQCGFSCKSFSRANNSFAALKTAMSVGADDTSVRTFHGSLETMIKLDKSGLTRCRYMSLVVPHCTGQKVTCSTGLTCRICHLVLHCTAQ